MRAHQVILLLASAAGAQAAVLPRQGVTSTPGPIIELDYSTYQGIVTDGVESWLGMPFAQPPIGDLRLRPPQSPPPKTTGVIQAAHFGPSCVQLASTHTLPNGVPIAVGAQILNSPLIAPLKIDSEDCLTINVQRPVGTTANDSLPVIAWIYGGAFEVGGSSAYAHQNVVKRSEALGTPVIVLSMNYRLNTYGFLGGKEVKEAGIANLGLMDQREALRWVQQHIGAFGGDPWGESAGAVSTGLQLVSNTAQTESNFRAAFMDSGGVLSVGPAEEPYRQLLFDRFSAAAGCNTTSDLVLACLRNVSTLAFRTASDSTANDNGLHFSYGPSSDSNFFLDNPQKLLLEGKHAMVPFINGDCEDEGTLFSGANTNISTNADFLAYLKQVWLPAATDDQIAAVGAAYPDDPAAGSPFRTGPLNSIYGQYKRIAAFQGDAWFQAPRRLLLKIMAPKVNAWSFLYSRQKALPVLGSFHASDMFLEVGLISTQALPTDLTENVPPVTVDNIYLDVLINFAVFLDPNSPAGRPKSLSNLINWPTWTPGGAMFTFVDSESDLEENAFDSPANIGTGVVQSPVEGLILTKDTYRTEAMEVLEAVFLAHPF